VKILQLIDTLNPGGAERMAVNYANSLNHLGYETFLVTTREEGGFKSLINKDVKYFFLQKENTFDRKSILAFKKILDQHVIEVVHAHGTSWFFAVLCKIFGGKFKLIWHNHHGASRKISFTKKIILKFFSRFFDGIISVNNDLKEWGDTNLKCLNTIMLNNFVIANKEIIRKPGGVMNIVCLANLKTVKNHYLLLKACDILENKINLNLHLIGRDLDNRYSKGLKKEFKKRSYIKYYGSVIDPIPILKNMHIGVISSRSEGMPLALLEYGATGLAVISTDVGAISQLLKGYGKIVQSDDFRGLSNAIKEYSNYPKKVENDATQFRQLVLNNYSDKAIIPSYLDFCKTL
jgi:glycosyltransferase involved in cell wall biosynthesis